jgi:hypothetical protein
MKVEIEKDEWWPVFVITRDPAGTIEIPDDLFDRYQAADAAFKAVQDELRDLYRAAYEHRTRGHVHAVKVFEWDPEGDGYKRSKPYGVMIDGEVLRSEKGNMRAFATAYSAGLHAAKELDRRNAVGKSGSQT